MLVVWPIDHLMCGNYGGLPNGPVFLCDNAKSTFDSQADKGN